MYKVFFGLTRNPFDITPDPAFLFPTKKHNEALAALYYGVKRRKGFVVLTGEVGTGKTVLVRRLLQMLSDSEIAFAYLFNPRLGPMEFLQYVVGDLRIPNPGKSKSELLVELSRYAISRYQKGVTTVVVVDEAHHLSAELLEEIRLLTNLETAKAKLLQILLIGQPELDATLDSADMRQLKQRVGVRSHLSALDLQETCGYIHHRLKIAGSKYPAAIFPSETVSELHLQSGGYPRLLNTLCENALAHGFASKSMRISPETIEEIATEFRLGVLCPSSTKRCELETSMDAVQAAKTLLDVYARLRDEHVSKADLRFAVTPGAGKSVRYA